MDFNSHYDAKRGYDSDHPGWLELVIANSRDIFESYDQYIVIVQWLTTTIEEPYRHARWTIDVHTENGNYSTRVKFRYERDYIIACLRWL